MKNFQQEMFNILHEDKQSDATCVFVPTTVQLQMWLGKVSKLSLALTQ